jgi:CheY-like chemotaxis protein
VIALTASAMKEDQEHVTQSGFDDSLLKPIERTALFESLCRFLPYTERESEETSKPQREESEKAETLSPETLEKLPELLDTLEHELMEQWNTVRQKQRIPDIEEFGKNMKVLGKEYGMPGLMEFGENLLLHVNNFDIDQMRATLETYPDMVQRIQQLTYKEVT